jgi:molecular chaperone GrpE
MTETNTTQPPGDRASKTAAKDGASESGSNETPMDLAAKLKDVEAERDEYKLLAMRTRADFENSQRRATREAAQEKRYAHGPLALELLPILDNLDRAVIAAKLAGETGPLVQGVGMVQSQYLDALKRHGITRIEALNQPFDPNLHQAVMQQPSDQPPNTVLQVLEQGYMLHDRVLRPARVIVSTAASGALTKSE